MGRVQRGRENFDVKKCVYPAGEYCAAAKPLPTSLLHEGREIPTGEEYLKGAKLLEEAANNAVSDIKVFTLERNKKKKHNNPLYTPVQVGVGWKQIQALPVYFKLGFGIPTCQQ